MNKKFNFFVLCLAMLFSAGMYAQTYVQENFNTGISPGWTVIDGGGAAGDSWISGLQGGTNSLDGTNCAFVDSDANGNGTHLIETLVSPVFDASAATTLKLDFDQYYNYLGSDSAVVEVFDGTSWVKVLEQTADAGSFTVPDQQSIDISAYKNTNMQVRFRYNDGNSWAWYWVIDNVVIYNQNCPQPSALTATNISSASADLGWTENGTAASWEIEYGAAGFTQGTGTTVVVGTNPYNLTGLTANTPYDYYVRAICGSGDTSILVGPFNFQTACAPTLTPWLDDVEAHSTTTNLSNSLCWNATAASGYDWNIDGLGSTPSGGTGPSGAFSGSNYFYIEASGSSVGDTAYLESPQIDLSGLTSPLLSFYYHMFGGEMGNLLIQANDGSGWTTIDSIIGQQQANQADPWLRRNVYALGSYTGIISIRFVAASAGTFEGDISLDNIEVLEAPACPEPTMLSVNNITSTSADLDWVENGSATNWEIEYGAAGFTQGTGTSVFTSTKPYNLTGLLENTSYDYYIRAICGVGDTSAWSLPFNFATPFACPTPTNLLTNNITPNAADLGWTENGTATSWEIEYGTAGFTQGTGTAVVVGTNPYNLTGLTDNTAYDFYVRAICGPGDTSLWAGPAGFATPCLPVTAPWLDDVEAHSTTTNLSISLCWNATSQSTYDWNIDGAGSTPSSGTGPSGAYSGSNYFYVEASSGATGDTAWLQTPDVDLTALTTPLLRFYYHMHGGDMGDLLVQVDDGSGWTTIDFISGEQQANQADPWLKRDVLALGTYSGTVSVRFAAVSAGSFEGDISLDDIEVLETPTCPSPSTLSTNNIAATSVDLDWTENGSATNWEIEYGATGFAQGTATSVFTATKPYALIGLTPNTAYEYYVRSVCGAGDSSIWAGPFSFSTPCTSFGLPYSENFDGVVPALPSCWSTNNTAEVFTTAGCAGSTNESMQVNGVPSAYAYSPIIDASTAQAVKVAYDYRAGAGTDCGNTPEAADNIDVDFWDGTAWVNLANYNGTNAPIVFTRDSFIITQGLTANFQLRFNMIFGSGSGFDNFNFDNVSIESVPPPPPYNMVISEIMYNPPEAGTDSLEFIELYNAGTTTADLQGYVMNGVTHTFGSTAIPAGGYYVIAVDSAAFDNVYGFAADAIWSSGGLNNGGESLSLYDPFGVLVDTVNYDDGGDWPSGAAAGQADGGGASIILCPLNTDNNLGTSWYAATMSTGSIVNGLGVLATPGADNGCPTFLDVATSISGLNTVNCNVSSISGDLLVINVGTDTTFNVPYTVNIDGTPVASGTVDTLVGGDTAIINVGPIPVVTGSGEVEAYTSLATDIDLNNDTSRMTVFISNIDATASVFFPISCNAGSDGQALVSATDGIGIYTFQWDATANNQITATATGLAAGNYMVTATDSIGCTDTSMVVMADPAAIIASVDSIFEVDCNGNSTGRLYISVANGTAPYDYLWSNGETTEDLVNFPANTYNVTVTDNNGCANTAGPFTINEPTALSLDSVNTMNVSCFGDSTGMIDITVSGGTAPYSFSWSNGATTEDLMNLPAGSYTGTITDANGCSIVGGPVTITEPTAALVASATDNGNSTATATATGGTSPYSFSWSTGDTSATIAAAGFVGVTVTDANGCTDTTSVDILLGVDINNAAALNFEVYPNPTQANTFVDFSLPASMDVQLQIVDVAGRVVLTQQINNVQEEIIELKTAQLPEGLYMVRLMSDSMQQTKKLVITK